MRLEHSLLVLRSLPQRLVISTQRSLNALGVTDALGIDTSRLERAGRLRTSWARLDTRRPRLLRLYDYHGRRLLDRYRWLSPTIVSTSLRVEELERGAWTPTE